MEQEIPELWVRATAVAAVGAYVLGLLFRNQVALRVLILAGSGFYVVYYAIVGPEPLWDAIIGAGLMIAANLVGLTGLLLSRARFAVRAEHRGFLAALGPIEPGLFRRLMRAGEVLRPEAETPMTEENSRPDALWFLVSGRARLEKFGRAVDVEIEGPCFVGEIAWLTGSPASANVTLLPGAEALRWRRESLDRALRRSLRLATALEALVAQDLAHKVRHGQPRATGLALAEAAG